MSLHILVIDDDPANLKLTTQILERSGYQVSTALGGEEGYKKVHEVKPDAILLDIDMPDMDGGTLAGKLRDYEPTSRIPVIFLTGLIKAEETSAHRCRGGHYYLEKPFEIEELLGLLKAALADSEKSCAPRPHR
jgi:CheY-like chemotaxis protein